MMAALSEEISDKIEEMSDLVILKKPNPRTYILTPKLSPPPGAPQVSCLLSNACDRITTV